MYFRQRETLWVVEARQQLRVSKRKELSYLVSHAASFFFKRATRVRNVSRLRENEPNMNHVQSRYKAFCGHRSL